jgi:hypothetical protein
MVALRRTVDTMHGQVDKNWRITRLCNLTLSLEFSQEFRYSKACH